MKEDNIISEKIKGQIDTFSRIISRGLSKPSKRFVSQILFGIQASRDVKLSNISRSLDEEINLIKTENRLSRNMQKEDLTRHVNKALIERGHKRIGKDTVLALDLSDIAKEFGKKMEHMGQVWDGSRGKVQNGYWICAVVGADVASDEVTPLYSELYSQHAKEFISENEQILEAVRVVNEKVCGRGIWAIDRGADRKILVEELHKMGVRFVIRMGSKRNITTGTDEVENIREYALRLRCKEEFAIEVNREGYEKKITISLSQAKQIKIGEVPLWLVVVKGFGAEPMMLVTNTEKCPREVLEIYLTRWKCEESFRFLKQEYHLEDVRVRSYVSLRNTVALVQAVFYFLSVYLGMRLKMNILLKKVLEKAKRFFQVSGFKQYAIADGISRLLFNTSWGPRQKPSPEVDPNQLAFRLAQEL